MFATTFVRSLNCFVLTVDNSYREAAIAWLRSQKVGFVLTVGKQTATFRMKYLRTQVRDRLNRKFSAPATPATPATRSSYALQHGAQSCLTASLMVPTFTRRHDGVYVLVIGSDRTLTVSRRLDELGCKADRTTRGGVTRFVFHVITPEALVRISQKYPLHDEYVAATTVPAPVVEESPAIEVAAVVVESTPEALNSINGKLWLHDRYCDAVVRGYDRRKQEELLLHYRTVSGKWSASEVPADFDPNAEESLVF